MKGMTLKNIALACNGSYIGDKKLEKEEIQGAVIDSRQVKEKYLFIPVAGKNVDGHNFINQVFEKGALCTLSEHKLDNPKGPYIFVKSSLQALKDIAEFYRKQLDVKVVGITGSVGKTSTKEMVYSVLSEKYNVLKTEGNFNNEIGLPLTVLKIRDEHEIAILEMGISDFGEMTRLSYIAKPDVVIITNIGTCHLENLKDRDGVFKAKTEVFENINKNSLVILNADDDKLVNVKNVKNSKTVFFGVEKDSDVTIVNSQNRGLDGTCVRIKAFDKEFDTMIHIPGNHMLYNAMAATITGIFFSMDTESISKGIEKLKPLDGRNNIIKNKNLTIIDDCYNANPVSMKASLDVLSMAKGHKTAILGDMFELGENEDKLHKEVGFYAADLNIDRIVCVGRLSKNIAEVLKDSETQILYYQKPEDLIEDIKNVVNENDTVLVKASHGMNFKIIVEKLISEE